MADKSKISWTDSTHNPWLVCSHVKLHDDGKGKNVLDEACRNCYAFTTTVERHKWANWGDGEDRKVTTEKTRNRPLAWYRKAVTEKRRHVVFCASLSDWLDDHDSIKPEWREHLYHLIDQTAPDENGYGLYWLMLSKRLDNFSKLAPKAWVQHGVPDNVMIGQSITTQLAAAARFPLFQTLEARHKFVSFEPLTHPVDIKPYVICPNCKGNGCDLCADTGLTFTWGIVGGESDMWLRDKVRPCFPHHVRPLMAAMGYWGIKTHFKQWGDWYPLEQRSYNPTPTDELLEAQRRGAVTYFDDRPFALVGKKVAGRLFDGVEYDGFPEPIKKKYRKVKKRKKAKK